MSLREDEIYCYVSPRGKPRTWTSGKTKKDVRETFNDVSYGKGWQEWEKDGFKIKKFRLVEVEKIKKETSLWTIRTGNHCDV